MLALYSVSFTLRTVFTGVTVNTGVFIGCNGQLLSVPGSGSSEVTPGVLGASPEVLSFGPLAAPSVFFLLTSEDLFGLTHFPM